MNFVDDDELSSLRSQEGVCIPEATLVDRGAGDPGRARWTWTSREAILRASVVLPTWRRPSSTTAGICLRRSSMYGAEAAGNHGAEVNPTEIER